jgi:hypothetical protein
MREIMKMVVIDTMDERLEMAVINIILGETLLRFEDTIIYLN